MPQNKSRLPDYRNSQSWSNLNPINAAQTATNADVTFLKRLFTLRVRTRNAFSLAMMLLFGIALTGFMSFTIYAAIITVDHSHGTRVWIYLAFAYFYGLFGFVWFIGVTLIINFVINIGIILGFVRSSFGMKNEKERNRKEAKKKLPKRRKDFR